MADERCCFAGDLAEWAIGRTVSGVNIHDELVTVAVSELIHRDSSYKGEHLTIIRGVTAGGHVTAHFSPSVTVTVLPSGEGVSS